VRPVETDLGEWIIQLAHEPPSHIIGPAIHKTREQVAELFSREVGRPLPPDDVALLTAEARRLLREKFLAAGIGISGVNVAVAETGSIVLVTNEGNGRMVTSLPPSTPVSSPVPLGVFERLPRLPRSRWPCVW